MRTCESSVNTFTDCDFVYAYASFIGQSVNTFTDCGFGDGYWIQFGEDATNVLVDSLLSNVKVGFEGNSQNTATRCELATPGWSGARENSQNTFSECTFSCAFEFTSPSDSLVDSCTFLEHVDTTLGLRGNTALPVADLLPGYHASTTIASSNDAFRLELADTTVHAFFIRAFDASQVTIDRSEIYCLQCYNYGATVVTDSQIERLTVDTASQTNGPVNVALQGFHDGPVPQDVDVTSDNSPFLISLRNSVVLESLWEFGDGGDPALPSSNLIEDCTITGHVHVVQHSALLARNSLLEGFGAAVGPGGVSGATASLTAEDCEVKGLGLVLYGADTSVVLRRSLLRAAVIFGNGWLAPEWYLDPHFSPHLVLESVSILPGYDPRVFVDPDIVDATISGDVQVHPSYSVAEWAPGSTVTRQFPVLVKESDGLPAQGAPVRVSDAYGDPVWSGVTGSDGYAYPEVTFDHSNYMSEFRVGAWVAGAADSAPLGFLLTTPVVLFPGLHPVSFTSFEEERCPWTVFACGDDLAVTWRQTGGAATWRPGVIAPPAHSGAYAMDADVLGNGITGLRLDLPVTPTWPTQCALRAWTRIEDRAGVGSSSFVGFSLADTYPTPTSAWDTALGWEVLSASTSRLQLGTGHVDLPVGLPVGQWYLVEVDYDRALHTLSLSVDGELVVEQSTDPLLGASRCAVLGALGREAGARQNTYFDDVAMTIAGPVPNSLPSHLFAGIEGPEVVVDSDTASYVIRYGNGHPALGVAPSPGDDGPQPLFIGLLLPDQFEFVGAIPAPTRFASGQPVWNVGVPYHGEENYICLEVASPTGTAGGFYDGFRVWATTDGGAATSEVPNPPDPGSPCDVVWSCPRDLLPQLVLTADMLLPDLWIAKEGPPTVASGDRVAYVLTVGNRGFVPATDLLVRDQMPAQLGGADLLVTSIAELSPGETWSGIVRGELPPGVPTDTLLLNTAYIPSSAAELSYGNNIAQFTSTVVAAHDPNAMYVLPEGGVEPGDTLTYTIECENEGGATAYGVYAVAYLDAQLDEDTLALGSGLDYDPGTRALLWDVGTLVPGEGDTVPFSVAVAADARRGRPIVGQAVVYFPSVGEETPTNTVLNMVNSSFPDIPWDHPAITHIECIYEHGITLGYPDGTYQTSILVSRGQMAVYVARGLAGGDYMVPSGPEYPTFGDVPTDHWGSKYIEYAVANEVVFGYPDGLYHPDFVVDRGQMAIFLARAIATPVGEPGLAGYVPPGPPTFPDVTPDPTDPYQACYKYVEYIAERGVTHGYPDGRYHPEFGCSRDQMAIYICRAFMLPM